MTYLESNFVTQLQTHVQMLRPADQTTWDRIIPTLENYSVDVFAGRFIDTIEGISADSGVIGALFGWLSINAPWYSTFYNQHETELSDLNTKSTPEVVEILAQAFLVDLSQQLPQ